MNKVTISNYNGLGYLCQQNRIDGADRYQCMWNMQGVLLDERWYRGDVLHRDLLPAVINWTQDGLSLLEWYCNGKKHRAKLPAVMYFDRYLTPSPDQVKKYWMLRPEQYDRLFVRGVEYWFHDKEHREDGPAIIIRNKLGDNLTCEYYTDGEHIKSCHYEGNDPDRPRRPITLTWG